MNWRILSRMVFIFLFVLIFSYCSLHDKKENISHSGVEIEKTGNAGIAEAGKNNEETAVSDPGLKKARDYALKKEYRKAEDEFKKAGRRNPALIIPSLIGQGECAFALWEEERAEAFFKKALAIDPNSSDAHQGMAKLRIEQDRLSEALAHLNQAENSSPDDAYLYVLEGRIYQLQKRYLEAESLFRKTISKFPYCSEAYLGLADILVDQGRYKETVDIVNSALKQNPDMDVCQELLQKTARAYHALGMDDKIDEIFQQVLKDEPDANFKYKMEANLYSGQEEFARGIPLYRKYLEKEPEDLEQRHNLCLALFSSHDYRECITECKYFLGKNPNHLRVKKMLIESLIQLGKYKEAEELIVKAGEIVGSDSGLIVAKANLERAKGNYIGAIKAYENILESDPDSENAHSDLGEIDLVIGDPRSAESHFKAVLKSDPSNIQATGGLAMSLKASGYDENFRKVYEQFIDMANRRLEKVPKDGEVWFILARVYLVAGRINDAKHALNNASQFAPYSLGPKAMFAYLALRDNNEAPMKEFIKNYPCELEARHLLADYYLKKGEKDLAVKEARVMIEIYPEDLRAKKIIEFTGREKR